MRRVRVRVATEALRLMAAQADDFFSAHDDDPSMCTLERAQADARAVFRKYGKA